jgi:hypothetical protein
VNKQGFFQCADHFLGNDTIACGPPCQNHHWSLELSAARLSSAGIYGMGSSGYYLFHESTNVCMCFSVCATAQSSWSESLCNYLYSRNLSCFVYSSLWCQPDNQKLYVRQPDIWSCYQSLSRTLSATFTWQQCSNEIISLTKPAKKKVTHFGRFMNNKASTPTEKQPKLVGRSHGLQEESPDPD